MNYLKDTLYLTESNTTLDTNGNPLLPGFSSGVLYITDSPIIAQSLLDAGYPVAAHSHEGNKSVCFPHVRYILENIEEIEDDDLEHIHRRVAGLPCDILHTERLYIRETTVEDVEDLINLYSDPSITRYMENLFPPEEEKEYQRMYIDNIYGLYDIGIWSVINTADNTLIGRMGIEYKDEPSCVELGFMLGTRYQHLGYAYEACQAIIDYAFTLPEIKAVTAKVHKNNASSIKLCQKLGMYQKETSQDIDILTYIIYK